jgi:hypothetical protein
MTLKDLLKKKDKIHEDGGAAGNNMLSPNQPEFTFVRTTTTTQSIIEPPRYPGDSPQSPHRPSHESHGLFGRLRKHSNAGQQQRPTSSSGKEKEKEEEGINSLTERLHLGHRSRSASSVNVPQNLPDVGDAVVARDEEDEARWEKRATMMAVGNSIARSGSTTPNIEVQNPLDAPGGRKRAVSVGKPDDDVGFRSKRYELGEGC